MDFDVLFLAASNPSSYRKYRPYIKNHVVQPETVIILDTIGEYYSSYPEAISVDWEALSSYLLATYALRLTPDKIAIIRNVIVKMTTFTPTLAYDEVIKSLIEMDYLAKIAEECSKARDGTSDIEAINELTIKALRDVDRYIDKKDLFVSSDLSSMVDRILSTGYEFRLMPLNRSLGLLRQGNFIIVAARVETGKTTFLASEVSYIAQQLPKGRPVVWVNNEEESEAVRFRVVQAALGKTTKEMVDNIKAAEEEFKAMMGGDENKILITNKEGNNNKAGLETMFRDVNPGMIIFDQLDKVNGFAKEEREDIVLGKKYAWARELAKEYGPVFAASQLSEGADMIPDPPFIGYNYLRGSKTDKPGEADVIITIGKYQKPANPDEEMIRTVNIPKNKLPGGGKYFVEGERHGKYMVKIDTLRARYE